MISYIFYISVVSMESFKNQHELSVASLFPVPLKGNVLNRSFSTLCGIDMVSVERDLELAKIRVFIKSQNSSKSG